MICSERSLLHLAVLSQARIRNKRELNRGESGNRFARSAETLSTQAVADKYIVWRPLALHG